MKLYALAPLTTYSMEPLDLAGNDLVALNQREIDKWSKLVRERGIKTGN